MAYITEAYKIMTSVDRVNVHRQVYKGWGIKNLRTWVQGIRGEI